MNAAHSRSQQHHAWFHIICAVWFHVTRTHLPAAVPCFRALANNDKCCATERRHVTAAGPLCLHAAIWWRRCLHHIPPVPHTTVLFPRTAATFQWACVTLEPTWRPRHLPNISLLAFPWLVWAGGPHPSPFPTLRVRADLTAHNLCLSAVSSTKLPSASVAIT